MFEIRSIVFLFPIVCLQLVLSDNQCRMPNGYTGECKYLEKCKPLMEIYRRKTKTFDELLYLKQSSCAFSSNFKMMVCCPRHIETFSSSEVKPIIFPEIVEYEREPPERPKIRSYPGSDLSKSSSPPLIDFSLFYDLPQGDQSDNIDPDECGIDSSNSNRIVGGKATDIDQYPWLVLLEYKFGQTNCGGSLINPRYVLTAAHCIETKLGRPLNARLSEYNTTSYPTDRVVVDGNGVDYITVTIIPVEWSQRHPLFNRQTYQHDIGLVRMARNAQYSEFIKPICLPRVNYLKTINPGTNFTVSGWGSDGSKFSDVKKDVNLPYVPIKVCKKVYEGRPVTGKQICAGGKLNEDSCVGDSGGPLMYHNGESFSAVGIVSFGYRHCGVKNIPGVYTNVYEYLDWIDNHIG